MYPPMTTFNTTNATAHQVALYEDKPFRGVVQMFYNEQCLNDADQLFMTYAVRLPDPEFPITFDGAHHLQHLLSRPAN